MTTPARAAARRAARRDRIPPQSHLGPNRAQRRHPFVMPLRKNGRTGRHRLGDVLRWFPKWMEF